jgi:hypothetical protein
MLYFPDEGHWVLKPQNSKLWYDEVGAWCDRWTKPGSGFLKAYAPVPAPSAAKAPEVPAVKAKTQEQGAVNTKVPVVPKAVTALPEVAAKNVPPPAAPKSPAAVQEPLQAGTAGGPFSITIRAPEDEVQIGSDMRVTITLKNLSTKQVLIARHTGADSPEFSYRIVVRDAAGREVEESAYGRGIRDERAQTAGRSIVDYVQPGGIAVQTAHIGRLVNLRRPGRYTVQVSRKDSASGVTVKSNEITLNIVP